LNAALPEPVARVSRFLLETRAEACLHEFRQLTPSAREAAHAIGCDLDQIVKSLVFVCDGRPVLVLVPGSRRADARKVAGAAGAALARIASPPQVREATGFEVGGVAPFGLLRIQRVLIDRSLLAFELVWTGAGSDRHVAGLSPLELARLTRAESVEVCADA